MLLEARDGALVRALFAPIERPAGEPTPDDAVLVQVARELAEYFAGERRDFEVPVGPPGTPCQQALWAELRRVPYGTRPPPTRSWPPGWAAPGAVRAVGSANGRNPLAVAACHRVTGSDGNLRGYAGGVERKTAALFAIERSSSAADGTLFSRAASDIRVPSAVASNRCSRHHAANGPRYCSSTDRTGRSAR